MPAPTGTLPSLSGEEIQNPFTTTTLSPMIGCSSLFSDTGHRKQNTTVLHLQKVYEYNSEQNWGQSNLMHVRSYESNSSKRNCVRRCFKVVLIAFLKYLLDLFHNLISLFFFFKSLLHNLMNAKVISEGEFLKFTKKVSKGLSSNDIFRFFLLRG